MRGGDVLKLSPSLEGDGIVEPPPHFVERLVRKANSVGGHTVSPKHNNTFVRVNACQTCIRSTSLVAAFWLSASAASLRFSTRRLCSDSCRCLLAYIHAKGKHCSIRREADSGFT